MSVDIVEIDIETTDHTETRWYEISGTLAGHEFYAERWAIVDDGYFLRVHDDSGRSANHSVADAIINLARSLA